MPVLDLDFSDPFAFARLFAVMLYPQDHRCREEFLTFAQEQAFLSMEMPKYRMLNTARKFYLYKKRPMDRGTWAGRAFLISLLATVHHPEHRGIERAFHAAPYMSKRPGTSRETVRKAWTTHKTVSHLWAVRCAMPQVFAQLFDPDELPGFVGLTEHLRLLGGSILDGHGPWEVKGTPSPLSFEIELGRLPEGVLQALREFFPRGRY